MYGSPVQHSFLRYYPRERRKKLPFAKNPKLLKVQSVKPGVGKVIALHAYTYLIYSYITDTNWTYTNIAYTNLTY